ncbi:hypothetical protein Hanom_Chr13g01243861 [Helianthus anomalus]
MEKPKDVEKPNNVNMDMQTVILRKLPVKSPLRFRKVSKTWKKHIHTLEFINDYIGHSYIITKQKESKDFVMYNDDDNFPENNTILANPGSVKHTPIAMSNGLLLLL